MSELAHLGQRSAGGPSIQAQVVLITLVEPVAVAAPAPAATTAQLAADRDVVLDIDTQGAAQVRALMPEAVSIFILPPSLAELEARLRTRGTDAEAVIERRLAAARAEIAHAREYDYAIINKDLDAAIGELVVVVRASRLRVARQAVRHAGLFGEFR